MPSTLPVERISVRASCSAGEVSLSESEAVDAIQALHGPGALSCELSAVLRAGGVVIVGGWTFTGTTLCAWCEEAPAVRTWYDEHNGPCAVCSECDPEAGHVRSGALLALMGAACTVSFALPLAHRVVELLGGVS